MIDPSDTGTFKHKDDVAELAEKDLKRLYDLHYLMYADNRRSLLVILQGIDASGKDGLTRHLASGFNPLGFRAESFKQPSALELDHDYLWRIHAAAPRRGDVAVFNRSHYEEVILPVVHPEILAGQQLPPEASDPKKLVTMRYRQINDFERMLSENGTVVVKFLLHISREEQMERLQKRQEDPTRQWKFSTGDLEERQHWDAYMNAYQRMIEHTSTDHAPWHIIPADKKWYRNYLVGKILVEVLQELKMEFPKMVSGV